jgi:hypothetical protein
MENKTSNENKVICRKCGGPHFTIKCGKEKKEEPVKTDQAITPLVEDKQEKPNKEFNKTSKENSNSNGEFKQRNRKDFHGDNKDFSQRGERKYFKVTYRVKLSELPTDMTEEELMELTTDWGHIVRIKLLVYEESSTAYIDFGYEDEADYFVEAIDKTPFEYRMLTSCRVESYRNDKSEKTTDE